MKLRTMVCLLCATFATGASMKATEAQPEAEKRPKVGLVLGGGGARGFAHIGVIQWLEEQQIPVDYVAGTSMGGLIGALYAMGYTPQEMTELVGDLSWEELMAAAPPYRDLTFRRKEDSRQYPVRLELGWNKGLATPSGLNPGHFIGLLFDRLSLPYWELDDFDDLPIPFRCVATDMEKGEAVVLDSGSLAMALRATMAIPGVFTPVEIDGKLLADGGVLDNLPVGTAKEMGAEIIIAVDVGSPLSDRAALESFLGLVNQSITIMMLDKVRQNMRLADILVVPELKGYETLDFKDFDKIRVQGFLGAEDKNLVLRAFSIDDQNWKEHLAARASRRKDVIPTPNSVQVTGTDVGRESKLATKLTPFSNTELDADLLEDELTAEYGRGRDYSLGYGLDGTAPNPALHVRVREKTYGPPFINLGLNINGSEMDNIRFGIRGRVTFMDLGRTGSELRFDGALGTPAVLATEYYAPLKKGFFLAPRAIYHRDNRNYFENGDQLANYRIRNAGAGMDLGYGFGLRSDEIRFGYAISSLDAGVKKGEPILPTLEGASGQFSLRWRHDSLDHPV
ncbi:MAG TPA: patatin-like phospholipase family protein, partial [Acidobacteriota bacterium]|nr:patatin-like phospholipase family protein [Acidobacteriota bacterium]